MEIDIEYLKKLEDATEKACRAAYENRSLIDDAVNWADLHCHEAKWSIDSHGHSFYEVVVEEASPGSSNLMKFISDYLEERGFDAIVSTEW